MILPRSVYILWAFVQAYERLGIGGTAMMCRFVVEQMDKRWLKYEVDEP